MRFNRIWQSVLRIGFSGNRNQPKNLLLRQAVEQVFSTTYFQNTRIFDTPTYFDRISCQKISKQQIICIFTTQLEHFI